jgi:hypothetical protein
MNEKLVELSLIDSVPFETSILIAEQEKVTEENIELFPHKKIGESVGYKYYSWGYREYSCKILRKLVLRHFW